MYTRRLRIFGAHKDFFLLRPYVARKGLFMEKHCEFALNLAREMGKETLKFFDRADLEVESKQDGSPVTKADRGAEELARRLIAEAFPDDSLLGEELPDREGKSGWQWILDPIDGTKSFIHGVPFYSNLVGVRKENEPTVGVIWIPALDRGVWAAKGQGAWEIVGAQTRPARVSNVDRLEKALFLTTDPNDFNKVGREGAYAELTGNCRLTRTWGDAYGYYLVATGRADIMVDPYFEVWDAAPLKTILEEAGGAFCDWRGVATIEGRDGVATNRALKDLTLDILTRFPKTKGPR